MNLPDQGQLHGPDYYVLACYFLLMMGIGVYFYRRMHRMTDYFTGGNRVPWWLSGVSFYMSCFSVFGFVTYSALAYQYGLVGVTVFWIGAPATLVSVVLFARKWRRARIDSPVEFLEQRYSPAVRQLFAWQGIPLKIIDDALKLVAIGIFISAGLGLPKTECIICSGLVMLVYTFMGGLWAVAVTDYVQFLVMTAAIVLLVPLSLAEVGGFSQFIQSAPDGFFNPIHAQYDGLYLGALLLLVCLSFGSNWALIQRYYCVPNERDAVKVGWLVVVLYVVGPPLVLFPAMAAREYLPGVEEAGQVYPRLCVQLLPVGMLGLVIAAMFSATMSMLSSDYNVCAGVLTNDVYRRYVRPAASQRELVHVGRGMTLVVGLSALGLACLMVEVGGEGLFRMMVKLMGVAAAPVALPMLAGLLTRRTTNRAALWGCLVGIGVGLALLAVVPDEPIVGGRLIKKEILLFGGSALATLITLVGISAACRPTPEERARVTEFSRRLATPIGQWAEDSIGEAPGSSDNSTLAVVGVSTGAVGAMLLTILPFVSESLAVTTNALVGGTFCLAGWLMWRRSRSTIGTENRKS